MPETSMHEAGGFGVLIVSILVWFTDKYITR
jgi:hypothetical protein